MKEYQEIEREFVIEAGRYLSDVGREFVGERAERNLNSDASINRLYQVVRAIRDGAAYFELPKVRNLAESLEMLLDQIQREGVQDTDSRVFAILLSGVQKLNLLVQSVAENEKICIQYELGEIEKLRAEIQRDAVLTA